jgi:hypothetical protein
MKIRLLLVFLIAATAAYAADGAATIFPSAAPGMTVEAVRTAFPALKEDPHAPPGASAFTVSDTEAASGIRMLFIDGKLALLSYQIKAGKNAMVFEAADKAYGARTEGDGQTGGVYQHEGASLQIVADPEEGLGSVTFVDPKAMEKLGK